MKVEIINDSISGEDRKAILSLVMNDADFLDTHVFSKNTPLYDFMAKREYIRTSLYLNRLALSGAQGANIAIARNNEGRLIGYILFVTGINNPLSYALINGIVHPKYRKKNKKCVFAEIISVLRQKSEVMAFSCKIGLVPLYEKLGFFVINHFETQISMSSNPSISADKVITINSAKLNTKKEVIDALNEFAAQAPEEYQQLLDKMVTDSKQAACEAKSYLQHKFNPSSK